MSGRSVIISLFVVAISFAMTMTNEVNRTWAAAYNRPLIDYNITSPVNYSDFGDTSTAGFNETYRNITSYGKPADVTQDYGFFQSLSATRIFTNLLLNIVVGVPNFLVLFGMPSFMVAPITVMLLINHVLTLIYLVTGKTFF